MKVAIMYDSHTGNTRLIAETIANNLNDVVYVGEVKDDIEADIYFIGSWTDRGNASSRVLEYFASHKGQKIAYFGTAGFGGSNEYFEKILSNVRSSIGDNTYLGGFMALGKMPMSVRDRYVKMRNEENKAHMDMMIANFDNSMSHPDEKDKENAVLWAKGIVQK